jgi:hypothetical protein
MAAGLPPQVCIRLRAGDCALRRRSELPEDPTNVLPDYFE